MKLIGLGVDSNGYSRMINPLQIQQVCQDPEGDLFFVVQGDVTMHINTNKSFDELVRDVENALSDSGQ